MWTEDIIRARRMTLQLHASQSYGNPKSIYGYETHLEHVVITLQAFLYKLPLPDRVCFIIAGYLHDAIEDSKYPDDVRADIRDAFGEKVLALVESVTDGLERTRKERKAATFKRLCGNRDGVILKLADRIANVEFGIYETKVMNSGFITPMLSMYLQELPDITKLVNQTYRPPEMADERDFIMQSMHRFLISICVREYPDVLIT